MVVFILLNALVGLSSYYFSSILFLQQTLADFCLSWFTLFFAQVIIVELFLGLSQILYLPNVIFLHLTVFLIVYLFTRRKPRFEFKIPKVNFIFENKILLLAIAIFLGFFIIKLWVNLINPPICPESHQYHLSFPAFWLKNGNLINPISVFGAWPISADLTALTYYPMNAELLFFWWMLPLKNAFIADVGQAVFYLLGILAIYSILRKYSLKNNTALLVSFLWAIIPNVFKQIRNGTQIDVMCAALFLMVLNYLLILNKKFNYKNALILGVTLGIFVGTKILNVFWSVTLLPLAAYFIISNAKKENYRSLFFVLSVVAATFFIFGSFSYFRTFILTGNPLYPVSVSLFGRTIFPGIIDKAGFSRLFIPWEQFSVKDMFFSEGLGLQFIAFVIPGTIIPFIVATFFKRKFNYSIEYILLFMLPLIMFCMYFFVIKALWIRYLFPYLGIGLIAVAVFLDKFKYGKKYLTFLGFICIFSSAAELAKRNELIFSFLLALLLFAIAFIFRKSLMRNLRNILSLKALLVMVIITFVVLFILNEKYNREEFNRYAISFKGKESAQVDIGRAWKWLNENTGSGMKIAYTGRSEFYPFFGSKLKNSVLYVSVNDKPPLAHFYADGLYRKEKNYGSWLNNLRKDKVDYLFIALPHKLNNESNDLKKFPIEDDWASGHAESFKLVFSNSLARIYKILL
ncbi:MAG: glycosyltransferase family 39 protein [Candidatus Omnitrophota bacterium]|nr:glycosyltransferase family 39 protein [Candidatus Omnitrophota bacterium]